MSDSTLPPELAQFVADAASANAMRDLILTPMEQDALLRANRALHEMHVAIDAGKMSADAITAWTSLLSGSLHVIIRQQLWKAKNEKEARLRKN